MLEMTPEEFQSIQRALAQLGTDAETLQSAVSVNPWFSADAIRESVRRMLPWFDKAAPALLRNTFGPPASTPKTIGIIMAGNLPLVGLHDLLITWLAGHQALVKLSRKDPFLLPRLVENLPESLQNRTRFTDKISPEEIDFLLATGSDNSARYFEEEFQKIPHIIRKNRFSVAILTGNESDEELAGLAEDIVLYNGMGCRSVSNVLVKEGLDLGKLNERIDSVMRSLATPALREVVRWEQAAEATKKGTSAAESPLVSVESPRLAPCKVGTLRVVRWQNAAHLQELIDAAKDHLQCVVGNGNEVAFGHTQNPSLTDFADGVNTYEILRNL